MSKQTSIQNIIEGCLKAKASSQKELVYRYSGILYTVCLRYMRDKMAAQDILQDSFIKIFKNIEKFDAERGSFEAWIRKITVNTAIKELNKRKVDTSSLSYDMMDVRSEDPYILNKFKAEDLLQLVRELPDMYRKVFNLYAIEGYSHKEIAGKLEIEEATSRSNLSRAKGILRKKISATKNLESWAKIS